MRAKVLFFGMLREMTGQSVEHAEFAEGTDLAAVFRSYAERYPAVASLQGSLVMARNQEFASPETKLSDGDEIAFLPPVSGGSREICGVELGEDGNYYAVTWTAIDTKAVVARVLSAADGAVVTFEGTVRNNTKGRATRFLDYEGYESMALKVMARIGRELTGEFAISHVAMVHRLGRMMIGEASVVIVAAAPHRRAAFEAALEGINRLKKQVPIWKKEHFVDGEVWVEGEWDRNVPLAR